MKTQAIRSLALAAVMIIAAVALGGCASGQLGGVGVYKFSGNAEGFMVEANSIKGGPDVDYSVAPDGTAHLVIGPSRAQAIDGLLQLLKP